MHKTVKLLDLAWQRWRATWRRGFYPAPERMPKTRAFWIALSIVALAVLAYSIYFIIFLTTKQDAFQTNGEDLGIMDQAIWSTLHGSFLHQTICNTLTDTNCYSPDGINRFAIHFEPILFPISLLYLIWPDPKTLMIFQALVVASGAFPAFWLARLRLRNNWAAIPFALLYLLYPAQQYAVNYDFHAVTLTTALLLFTLYFMYTRRTLWFFVCALLCLACKEEIAGVIALLGLWVWIFQRRRWVGLSMVAMALSYLGLGLLIVHFSSPLGHSLLASRWSYLGKGPLQIALYILTHPISLIKDHLLEHSHRLYLSKLLAPAAYLPLLAPWVLILAAPTLALNLLSDSPNMYSGRFQYNAEIIPILIFASIEATVLIIWIVRLVMVKLNAPATPEPDAEASTSLSIKPAWRSTTSLIQIAVLVLLLGYMLTRVFMATTEYNVYSAMPYARGFTWPHITQHDKLAQHFLDQIPADASVSTQTALVPHLSQRVSIYLFPYAVNRATYILLDATGYFYPYKSYADYAIAAKALIQSGTYGIIDLQDGYILLKRGAPPTQVAPALQMIDADAHSY